MSYEMKPIDIKQELIKGNFLQKTFGSAQVGCFITPAAFSTVA